MEGIVSEIRGFVACRARLDELLAEADEARASKDGDRADRIAASFAAFANDSRPEDPADAAEVAAIAQLDQLAEKVQNEMTAVAIGQAVESVTGHAAELEAIGKTLRRQTLVNSDAVRRIRLVPVRDLIDRMSGTVAAAKVVAKSLDARNLDEKALQAEIGAFAERFEGLVRTAHSAFGKTQDGMET
jgi:hypothetical protein